MSKVHVMDHPLISHKISYIRKEDLGSKDFREMISEIAMLICYEATRDLKLQDVKIKTPLITSMDMLWTFLATSRTNPMEIIEPINAAMIMAAEPMEIDLLRK